MLFKRNPLMYFLPAAMYISMFQALHETEYDHSGMVVIEPNGVPMVLETNFGNRVQYRPYSDRIQRSKAEQIVLVPIRNRQDENNVERESNSKLVSRLKKEYEQKNESFLAGAYRGLIAAGVEKLSNYCLDIPYSPAAYLTAEAVIEQNSSSSPRDPDLRLGPAEYFLLQIVKKKMEIQRADCDGDR